VNVNPSPTRENLQRLHDDVDIAEARAREAGASLVPVPHDEFMAQLKAEDEHQHEESTS
jgi:hypothetical protein